jgi:hypothetical protein
MVKDAGWGVLISINLCRAREFELMNRQLTIFQRQALEAFLKLSIPYKPNLSQRLPAEEGYKLERDSEYRDLEDKIIVLRDKKNTNSSDRHKELLQKRRTLIDETLQKWQKDQSYRLNDPPLYYCGIFDRC